MFRSKLYMALALVVIMSLLAGGSTLALFSAQSQLLDNNIMTSARLVITSDRDDGDTIPGPMFYVNQQQGESQGGAPAQYPTGLWAPGDSQVRNLIVRNMRSDGSTLNAWLKRVTVTLNQGSDIDLADKLYVVITTSKPPYPPQNDFVIARGTLREFMAGKELLYEVDNSKVPQVLDSIRYLKFTVTFDRDAGNAYQGKNLVANFAVTAEQMIHNP
ncbi:MAG: hypothetical protein ACOY4I_03945 [Bacillota bacterium]